MEIISLKYLSFLIGFLIVFQITEKYKKTVILIGSLTFYLSISLPVFLALVFSILFNYWISCSNYPFKKALVITINLGILFIFKFFNSSVLIPIGVSFFTFQALSFVFDFENKERVSLLNFSNYLCFFPQIVAGPIEPYSKLGPQLSNLENIKKKNIFPASHLILKGLVLKYVIANRCDLIVNSFYNRISEFDNWFFLGSNLLFTFQILFDFSGYCLIALGIARILGIRLSENFNSPYRATSLSDFWKRWHITLHLWFRNYIFKPLLKKTTFSYAAIIVFALSSLWHGIKINFIIWGFLCVTLLLFDKFYFQKWTKSIPLKWLFTFSSIFICWVPFRINKPSQFLEIFKLNWGLKKAKLMIADHIFVLKNDFLMNLSNQCEYGGLTIGITYLDFYILIFSLIGYLTLAHFKISKKFGYFYSSIILFVVFSFLGYNNSTPFIYFQF